MIVQIRFQLALVIGKVKSDLKLRQLIKIILFRNFLEFSAVETIKTNNYFCESNKGRSFDGNFPTIYLLFIEETTEHMFSVWIDEQLLDCLAKIAYNKKMEEAATIINNITTSFLSTTYQRDLLSKQKASAAQPVLFQNVLVLYFQLCQRNILTRR